MGFLFFWPSNAFISDSLQFQLITCLQFNVRKMAPLQVDNSNPSFLSHRHGFPNETYAFILRFLRFFQMRGFVLRFFGFSIFSSKRIRQRQDSNRQPPDLIHDELDHSTVSCFNTQNIILEFCAKIIVFKNLHLICSGHFRRFV